METLLSQYYKLSAPMDNIGTKRKRGRPRKYYIKSLEGPRSPTPKGEPSTNIKRGRLRKYSSRPSPTSPSMSLGKLGISRIKGNPRRHYSTSSTGSSYRLENSQSHDMFNSHSKDKLEISNNDLESESEYELIESSRPQSL